MAIEIKPVAVRRREHGLAVLFTGDNQAEVADWVMSQLTGPEMVAPWMIDEPLVHPGDWVVVYHPDNKAESAGVGVRFVNEKTYREMFEETSGD